MEEVQQKKRGRGRPLGSKQDKVMTIIRLRIAEEDWKEFLSYNPNASLALREIIKEENRRERLRNAIKRINKVRED